MRERKPRPVKTYEYCIPSKDPDAWHVIQLQGGDDEFDAAEEAAEDLHNKIGVDEWPHLMVEGKVGVIIREQAQPSEMWAFDVERELSPRFHVKAALN